MSTEPVFTPKQYRAHIKQRIDESVVENVQIDVNGYCNNGCWYCPIGYEPNKADTRLHMPISQVEQIFQQIEENRGGIIKQRFCVISSAHFNEILLYRHFEPFLALLRKYNYKTWILSNGLTLMPDKTDLLVEYSDVIEKILMNIGAYGAETWSRFTRQPIRNYQRLLQNIQYLHDNVDKFPAKSVVFDLFAPFERKGFLTVLLPQSPFKSMTESSEFLIQQRAALLEDFPKFVVYRGDITDRAGVLAEHQVIKIQKLIGGTRIPGMQDQVVDCEPGLDHNGRAFSQMFNWLHVNARGDLFLCCCDLRYEYLWGNILETPLKTLWGSQQHVDNIARAMQHFCRSCDRAHWRGEPIPQRPR